MKMIVAVDKNWGIGKNNDLLVSIPADMKMFRTGDFRQGSCNGKEDSGKLSWRTAIKESY